LRGSERDTAKDILLQDRRSAACGKTIGRKTPANRFTTIAIRPAVLLWVLLTHNKLLLFFFNSLKTAWLRDRVQKQAVLVAIGGYPERKASQTQQKCRN
jgi:hypothetical protein